MDTIYTLHLKYYHVAIEKFTGGGGRGKDEEDST